MSSRKAGKMTRKTKRQVAGALVVVAVVAAGSVFGFAPEAAMEFAMELLATLGMAQ